MRPAAVDCRARLFSMSETKKYSRNAPDFHHPSLRRKPIVPPERTMSEAAPLRNACQEHLVMPMARPRRRSSDDARRTLRLPKTLSCLEPPRRRCGWAAANRELTSHLARRATFAADATARDARSTLNRLRRDHVTIVDAVLLTLLLPAASDASSYRPPWHVPSHALAAFRLGMPTIKLMVCEAFIVLTAIVLCILIWHDLRTLRLSMLMFPPITPSCNTVTKSHDAHLFPK